MINRDVVRQVVLGVWEGVVISVVVYGGLFAVYWLFTS